MQAPAFHRREPRALSHRHIAPPTARHGRTSQAAPAHESEGTPLSLAARVQLAGLVLGGLAGLLVVALLAGLISDAVMVPDRFAPAGVLPIGAAITGGALAGASLGGFIGGSLGLALEARPGMQIVEHSRVPTLRVDRDTSIDQARHQ